MAKINLNRVQINITKTRLLEWGETLWNQEHLDRVQINTEYDENKVARTGEIRWNQVQPSALTQKCDHSFFRTRAAGYD